MGSAARRLAVAAMCFSSFLVARTSPTLAGVAATSSSDPLSEARSWFADALRDEEGGRFAEALGKFQRVRDVRDTAAVEYRIGTCYDGLGQPLPAYLAYRQAAALGQRDAASADVVEASTARLDALGKLLARLTITFSMTAPSDVEVRVDGAVVASAGLVAPIPLAPGQHVVTAIAKDNLPFRAEVPLAAGTDAWVTIALARAGAEAARPSRSSTAGWLAFAGGTTLIAASAVLLFVRHDEIAALHRNCPADACPPGADRIDLESTRSRALVEGPVAVGCGIAGAVAVALGTVLVLRANGPSPAQGGLQIAPVFGLRAAGVLLAGDLP